MPFQVRSSGSTPGKLASKKNFPGTDPALELKKLQTGFQNGKNMPI